MTEVLDLCSGGLGQHLTALLLGWSTAAVVERDPWCLSVAEARLPSAVRFNDARTFPAKRFAGIDGMLAGWPCQPHSDAGRKLGADDERDLLDGILRALRLVRPGFAFLENVPAVLRTDGGRYFGRLLDALARLGYAAEWGVLGARDAGAPHRRLRLWLLAYASRERLARCAQPNGPSDESAHQRRYADGCGQADWATPCARDERSGTGSSQHRARREAEGYSVQLAEQVGALLNPAWVASLMGWPLDWLDLDQPGTDWPAEDRRGWPAGRMLDGPSPQRHWEPARTVPPRAVRNRCSKVKALGNGWVPQAAALAFRRLAARALAELPARQEHLFAGPN